MLVILTEDNLQKNRLKCICLTDLVIYAILELLAEKQIMHCASTIPLAFFELTIETCELCQPKRCFYIITVPNEIFPLNDARFLHPSNLQVSFNRM